eukprot:TRINITY_DN3957_c0_g1_i2.p1 TRINITY_DN3957_c0_g1~~TRINITY_DN3957_c0_g1_i2.p1  ORF type:complete len:222 (-),score=33.10 TRINITY_DN3957_c0_g1_i2:81-746(-)
MTPTVVGKPSSELNQSGGNSFELPSGISQHGSLLLPALLQRSKQGLAQLKSKANASRAPVSVKSIDLSIHDLSKITFEAVNRTNDVELHKSRSYINFGRPSAPRNSRSRETKRRKTSKEQRVRSLSGVNSPIGSEEMRGSRTPALLRSKTQQGLAAAEVTQQTSKDNVPMNEQYRSLMSRLSRVLNQHRRREELWCQERRAFEERVKALEMKVRLLEMGGL